MANIQERRDATGKTRFRVQVRLKGYPPQTATFDRKTDATQWAQLVESDMKAGRHLPGIEARRRTVSDMIGRYLKEVMPAKRPNSSRSQIPQLNWWSQRLGRHSLADVSPALVAEGRDMLAAEKTPSGTLRSPSTVVRYLAVLSHCFTVAVNEWGWLDDNPVRRVTKPRQPPGRVRFLSEAEMERLLSTCQETTSPYLHAVVMVALSTGMRRGEILNLTWDRVDIARGLIMLLPENTKTREARGVPLVGKAHEALMGISRQRRTDTNLVFPAPQQNGKDPKPLDIRTAWDTAVRRALLEDFRFHDLRHTAASYLAMNGATLVEIAAVLGHKTLAMVQRYSHLTVAHTTKIVERTNEAMFGNGGKNDHETQ